MSINSPTKPALRSQWVRHWSALPPAEIKALAATLSARHAVEDLHLPQSGLGLLPLADSALGDHYYLGEIPLARAHVRVRTQSGTTVEGAALLLDDRAALARSMAILDAVLATELPGCEEARELLEKGAIAIAQQERERRALLAATRVDFSLMGTAEEDDDE